MLCSSSSYTPRGVTSYSLSAIAHLEDAYHFWRRVRKVILLQTTVHAGLGKWLEKEQVVRQEPDLPGGQSSAALEGHPSLVLWMSRICLSLGSLVVVIPVRLPSHPAA